MESVYDYPWAQATDNFLKIKCVEIKEIEPPSRILIVSPTSNGCDHILNLLSPLSKVYKIIRIGNSTSKPDLDKKFGLNLNLKDDA